MTPALAFMIFLTLVPVALFIFVKANEKKHKQA